MGIKGKEMQEIEDSPSFLVKAGWRRRESFVDGGGSTTYPTLRKSSSISTVSSSVATTKSLSSNTDFTLPSPPNSNGKPKWRASTKGTKLPEIFEKSSNSERFSAKKNESRSPRRKDTSAVQPGSERSQSGTSYGSLTLGGAESLSSTDTFQNSSRLPKQHLQSSESILKHDLSQEGGCVSHATQKHSNGIGRKRYLPHSTLHYQLYGGTRQPILEEVEWSSSLSDEGEIQHLKQNSARYWKATSPMKNQGKAPVTWTKKEEKSSGIGKNQELKSSSASMKQSKRSPKKRKVKKKHREKENISSHKHNRPTNMKKDDILLQESYVKCTNNPAQSSGRCAGMEIDLAAWQSDGDSSSEYRPRGSHAQSLAVRIRRRIPKRQSNWKSPLFSEDDNQSPSPSSFPVPSTAAGDGKPRSAYDKNAEWYCGSDDEKDSIVSDGSSVLSAFRPKKQLLATQIGPQSEASMDFGALLGSEKEGSSKDSEADENTVLDMFQKSRNRSQLGGQLTWLPDLEAGSIRDDHGGDGVLELKSTQIEQDDVDALKNDQIMLEGIPQTETPDTVPQNTNVGETESCSPSESVHIMTPSSPSVADPSESNQSFIKKLTSKRGFQWIMVGIVVMLVLDIALLAMFLVGR